MPTFGSATQVAPVRGCCMVLLWSLRRTSEGACMQARLPYLVTTGFSFWLFKKPYFLNAFFPPALDPYIHQLRQLGRFKLRIFNREEKKEDTACSLLMSKWNFLNDRESWSLSHNSSCWLVERERLTQWGSVGWCWCCTASHLSNGS